MATSIIIDHIVISIVAWLVGVAVGGAAGYLCSVLARALFASVPNSRTLSILIPWRTVLLGLLMVTWTPTIVLVVGLGRVADMITTALVTSFLAAPLVVSVFLENSYPSPLAIRLIAALRTLGTASPVILAAAGMFAGGGIGGTMLTATMLLQYNLLLQAWLVVVSLVLVVDILLGIVQMRVQNSVTKQQALHAIAGVILRAIMVQVSSPKLALRHI